jgi:DNA-binding HxlR family transcriptional regulator
LALLRFCHPREGFETGPIFELVPTTRPCQHVGMQKYKQYCPVARASEILADRWTPLIVRELILGSHRFNEIDRGLPGISRSLLSSRLRDLEDAGVVERLPRAQSKVGEYHLSEAGRELSSVIEALGAWGVSWAFGDPRPEELDAALLVWKIHQRINRDLLPDTRTVVEFDFTARAEGGCGWCSSAVRCPSASRLPGSIPT